MELLADLNNLMDWADTWQLCFNVEKCKILHLGNKNRKYDCHKRCHGSDNRRVSQKSEMETDLGVKVDCELFMMHRNQSNCLQRQLYEHQGVGLGVTQDAVDCLSVTTRRVCKHSLVTLL